MNWDAATDRQIIEEFISEIFCHSLDDMEYDALASDLVRRKIDPAMLLEDVQIFVEDMKVKYAHSNKWPER